jgi:hypothetical protein
LQAENWRPELWQFANHWAVEFLARESFNNHFNYQLKQTNKLPSQQSSISTLTHRSPEVDSQSSQDSTGDDNTQKDNMCRAELHKAAAYQAAERKTAKLKQVAQDDSDRDDALYNDSETEPENIPDNLHRKIECEEIGVPGKLLVPFYIIVC